ncbi:uncharacterized protein LOC129598297 [Paramacrobiotus metropolitanus]|uniref:uncharacterized protein LOC129598297 n=1 Tax=Paramacrobiotus metropolitanus TaxID=2943436 RepID=UPI0024460550|nr:uncharacterized protein LOC129598297 [Paramacrobiotus metropolitanus]
MEESTNSCVAGAALADRLEDAVLLPRPRYLYQPLLADGSQMSYCNTVAARIRRRDANVNDIDGDIWWLGYIQDIDTDGECGRAFIHFNATTAPARWLPMQDVWPLPTYYDELQGRFGRNAPILAALRDDENGPFRFRPAVMLESFQACKWACDFGCHLFCIRTDVSSSGSGSGSGARPCVEVVHPNQLASALPPSASAPSSPEPERASVSGVLYTKHWIPFARARARALLSEPSDKFRIIKHLRDALPGQYSLVEDEPLDDCCRFHLRIADEGCTIIVVGLAKDKDAQSRSARWMAASLPAVLETHLASRALLPPLHAPAAALHTSCMDSVPVAVAVETDVDIDAAMLSDLTPWLLSDILSHLDLHSQMRAKRVCGLWQLLLGHPRMQEHVSISFESCWHLQVDSDSCFRAASLLTRSLSSATVTLTLLRALAPAVIPGFPAFLQAILSALEISLPVLVLKDYVDMQRDVLSVTPFHQAHFKPADKILYYKGTCDFILLDNWQVRNLFGRHMYDVFELGRSYDDVPGRPLPEQERQWTRRLSQWPVSPELAVDELQITIPKLLLPCSDDKMHTTSRFMCAVNEHFPPVTPEMLAKVTAVHARWQRTLDYPADWESIRCYLLLFSGFHSDGRPKCWDEVDLRCVDISAWSRVAIYGINELFRV